MKKLTLAVLLAAGIVAAGITFAQIQKHQTKKYVENLIASNPASYLVIDDLVVNTQNKQRTIIIQNEKQGIKDIKDLVASSDFEEAWAYLPDRKLWIELGINEYNEVLNDKIYHSNVTLDGKLLSKLMKENNRIIIYHFNKVKTDKVMEEKDWERVHIHEAVPNYKDLQNMIINSSIFYSQKPGGDIRYKIGSFYGVTETRLTKKGREKYNFIPNYPLPQLVDKYIELETMVMTKKVLGFEDEIKETKPIPKIKKLCRILNLFEVTYSSFKSY